MSHYARRNQAAEQQYEEKLRQHGFSAADATALKNMTRTMASKVVCKYVTDFVEHAAVEENLTNCTDKTNPRFKLYRKILATLRKQSPESFVGYIEMTIDDVEGAAHKLRLQLSVVDSNSELSIAVPPMNEQDTVIRTIFTYIDRLVNLTTGYYSHILVTSELLADLAEFFPNVDVSKFQINVNNRNMYFDENYGKRIGIIAFYVDGAGKPLAC